MPPEAPVTRATLPLKSPEPAIGISLSELVYRA
jgi:hypothetical protein